MAYGDDRFGDLLSKVERMSKAPVYSTYDSEQKSMANKFFAILSSYMRGRTSASVRSFPVMRRAVQGVLTFFKTADVEPCPDLSTVSIIQFEIIYAGTDLEF